MDSSQSFPPWDNDNDDWVDFTELANQVHINMSPGQIICDKSYSSSHAMNGWIVMDPKLDPDALSAPVRVNNLLQLTPTLIPLSPTLPQTLSIINYYFSQLQAFYAGSPLFACLGSSLYMLKHREIECPLLRTFTQLFIKIAYRSYNIIDSNDDTHEDEFCECYPAQLKEIDWCEDLSHSDILSQTQTQIEILELYVSTLLDIIDSNLDLFRSTTDLNQFDLTMMGSNNNNNNNNNNNDNNNGKDKLQSLLQKLQSHQYYSQLTTLEQSANCYKFNIIDQYILTNQLLSRLRYLQSFYLTLIALSTNLDMKFPEFSISTVNNNSHGIIDGLTNALNMVWIYNQHIKPTMTFFEQRFFTPPDNISNCPEITNPTPLLPELHPPPPHDNIINVKNSLFYQLYQTAIKTKFATPEIPFLSRIAPTPSQIQIKFHFDPFSVYTHLDSVTYEPHPNIIDDVSIALQPGFVLPENSLLLSSLLPSPCLGLFPHILANGTTASLMLRPFEYASPAVSIETITLSFSKLITVLSALVSVLPAKYHPLPDIFSNIDSPAPVQSQQSSGKGNNNNNKKGSNNNNNSKQQQQQQQQKQQPQIKVTPTEPTFHTHIPTYTHIPHLKPFLDLTIPCPTQENPSNRQLLLPPPLSPYLTYSSLSEQLLLILQSFSNLHPNLLIRSLMLSISGNQLDYFGVGRVDAHSEYFLRSRAPGLQGWLELPLPVKPLQIFGEQYVNSDDLIKAEDDVQNDNATTTTATTTIITTTTTTKSTTTKSTTTKQQEDVTKTLELQQKQQKQKAAKIRAENDDNFWMGHRSTKLSEAQIQALKFSELFVQLMTTYTENPCRQRRHFVASLPDLNTMQSECEEHDQLHYDALKAIGLQPSFTTQNTEKKSGPIRGNSVTTRFPLYAQSCLIILEQLALYFINSVQLGMVTNKEYFLFLFIIDLILEQMESINAFSRHVGVKEGHASTGPLKPILSYHYISYRIQTVFSPQYQNKKNTSKIKNELFPYFNLTFCPITAITTTTATTTSTPLSSTNPKSSNLWTIPKRISSAQTYGNLRYLPQPIITAGINVRRKLKYTAQDAQAFQLGFPLDDSSFATYQPYKYTASAGQWSLQVVGDDKVNLSNQRTSSTTGKTTTTTTTAAAGKSTKPTGKLPPQPQTTQPVPHITTTLPQLYYPPRSPQLSMMMLYRHIYKIHFSLLVIAKTMGFTIPQHILLSTLRYQPETTSFILESKSDKVLLEKYMSNRYSTLYRTYYPTAQSFDSWLTKVNSIAGLGTKAVIADISQRVKDIKFNIQQFLSLYGGDVVVNNSVSDIVITPSQRSNQRDLSHITRYDNIPCNTIFNESNKTSTTHPTFDLPLPHISTLSILDPYIYQCESLLIHVNKVITPLLMALLKVSNQKARPGKIDIQFTTNLDPNNSFVDIIPQFSFTLCDE
jgi:hypothetical protein